MRHGTVHEPLALYAGSSDQGLDSLLAEAAPSGNGKHRRQAMHTSWRPWTAEERAEASREGGPI